MSIIFVGSAVDRETLKHLPDASVAGNKMQIGFVKGFIENGIRTRMVSVEAHAMWRFNRKPIFVTKKKLQDDGVEIETIPYINLPFIKQITIMHNLQRKIRQLLKSEAFAQSRLIVYNTMTIFAQPVLRIAREKKCVCLGVIADLPIRTSQSLIRKIEDRRQMNAIKNFTGLIPLTEHIAKDFAYGKPYYVIEAGCNPSDYAVQNDNPTYNEKKKIVFSGTLNELSGIELILDTMKHLNNEKISLHIYGDGPLKQFVVESVLNVKNVVYHGRVSNDQMIQIQKNADLLICPRKKDNFTTKYTFPSKILEYICSGVPVLSNQLMGIPQEYAEYINFASSEDPVDWANSIRTILSVDNMMHYKKKALSARDVVLQKKTWTYQVFQAIRYFKNEGVLLQ